MIIGRLFKVQWAASLSLGTACARDGTLLVSPQAERLLSIDQYGMFLPTMPICVNVCGLLTPRPTGCSCEVPRPTLANKAVKQSLLAFETSFLV